MKFYKNKNSPEGGFTESESVEAASHVLLTKMEYNELQEKQKLCLALLDQIKNKANADRKIEPKKSHNGFVVLSSEQFKYTKWNQSFFFWRTRFQTPYSVQLTFENVKKCLQLAFFAEDGAKKDFSLNEDVIYKEDETTLLKMNPISGFWELTLIHKDPIKI